MEETRGEGEEGVEEEVVGGAAALPPQMQLLSTWEVRRVPHNCVTRLCTVTVTKLEVRQALEPSLPSVVVAVAMKTPHRFLRSNEIPLPPAGTLDIPLQLTFALQYPHFLKRGGNILQIRVQRRKRYRNRAIGGYKTLAMGTLEMSQVLQTSYAGEVHLLSEKPPQAVAVVTVGNLTSTPVYLESQREGSSDDEEDELAYSDYHGSDSDSGEGAEVYRSSHHAHKLKTKAAKPSSRMLRLLGIKSSKTHAAEDELMDLQGEDPECAVTFASSVSESEEEEEGVGGPSTPPRPTLSPFFGSDRCSMVSIPNSVRSAEVGSEFIQQPPAALSVLKQSSLEENAAPAEGEDTGEGVSGEGGEVGRRRVWVVGEESVAGVLRQVGERVLLGGKEKGREEVVSKILPPITSLASFESGMLCVAVVGEDWMLSAVLQVVLQITNPPSKSPPIHLIVIPTCSGMVLSKVCLLDESLSSSFPLDTDWSSLPSSSLLHYAESAIHTHPLPVAHVLLQRTPTPHDTSASAADPSPLPFMFSVSVGSLDAESETLQSPPSASSVSEATELVVEYWTGKKEREKISLKVRCVMAVCDGQQGLNVTTISRDKRGKGIRIRKKEKEVEGGSSITSLSTSQLLCRPANKQDSLSVVVDGVEWADVNSLKITANTGHFITIATAANSAPPTELPH